MGIKTKRIVLFITHNITNTHFVLMIGYMKSLILTWTRLWLSKESNTKLLGKEVKVFFFLVLVSFPLKILHSIPFFQYPQKR